MHDGMPYDPIQGQGQGHKRLTVWNCYIFKVCLLCHIQTEHGRVLYWANLLNISHEQFKSGLQLVSSSCRVTVSTRSAVGPSQWLVQCPGTHYRTVSASRRVMTTFQTTVSNIHWKHFSLVDIDVPSAVEVFTTLRSINLHLLTYLLYLLVVHSNICHIMHRLRKFWCETVLWPWNISKVIDSRFNWQLSCDILLTVSVSVDVSYIISEILDVWMTAEAEITFKCHLRSSNVVPIESSYMSCY